MTGRVSDLALSQISEAIRDNPSVTALDALLETQQNLSNVEVVDLAQVLLNLQAQAATYQSALAAAGKAIQPSLAAFLQ